MPDPKRPQPGGGQQGARSICKKDAKRKATICDPSLRTVNTNAVCGSDQDYYYYAPWRAPGTAPVIDACGVAGGRLPEQGTRYITRFRSSSSSSSSTIVSYVCAMERVDNIYILRSIYIPPEVYIINKRNSRLHTLVPSPIHADVRTFR